MIAKMRKLSLLAYHRDRERLLARLQELGVVHVSVNPHAASSDLHKLDDTLKAAERALKTLRQAGKAIGASEADNSLSAEEIVMRCEALERESERIETRLQVLEKNQAALEPWGNFDPASVRRLGEMGVRMRFYVASEKKFAALRSSHLPLEVISVHDGVVHFVVFERSGASAPLDAEEVVLAEISLEAVAGEIARLRQEKAGLDAERAKLSARLPVVQQWIAQIENCRALERARISMESGAKGAVLAMTGWVPQEKEKDLAPALDALGVWSQFEDPAPGEEAPILLKQNAFTRLFEPIIKLFQLPSYVELDPTPAVAPFYALFFGNCLGDAGYGAIIIIASLVALGKVPTAMKRFALFGMILGVSTLVMGLVNGGTAFGLPIQEHVGVLGFELLSRIILIKNGQAITPFTFALLLGVIQINVGMLMNIVNRWIFGSFTRALPGVAKMMIIDGMIVLFLAGYQNVAALKPFFALALWAAIGGVVLMGYAIVGAGMESLMGNRAADFVLKLYFTISGAIGDILSYVRLFALGLSSGILGYVINVIGMQMAGIPYIGWLAAVVFLLGGHTLNLLLAMLGSFVHPLRLTFVEFYNNLEFKGGGVEYSPLKKPT